MYPNLTIDEKKLRDNCDYLSRLCDDHGISMLPVVKAFAGYLPGINIIASCGFCRIADSRLENLKRMHALSQKKVLLRIPMPAEAEDVVRYTDISLNSELKTIRALNEAAKKNNTIHKIVLMFDVGDLREGVYHRSDYLKMTEEILSLTYIRLHGIGTNLTCYGGLIPSEAIDSRLATIKMKIETAFSIRLKIISGGNSSSIPLLFKGKIHPDINELRLGESLLLGRETAYGTRIKNMHPDVFCLKAELIEVKTKPSYPDGDIGMNSFGEKPAIHDEGMMKRGLLAIGKQDVNLTHLTPLDDIRILGGSSDHLIADLKGHDYEVGDFLRFSVNYPALVHLMNSAYVHKTIKK